ncbi:AcrR family transcriptional regulator [Mumia flava]|uniref:AcrR family transcriptional regulator n=1 Tax=Mumia flava TaxID=1348852 RepID=A0A0B2B9R1_9ACTN|nr:TetR family transcriptional regulator C-terminal domain-containing protein [Mumia flava]PJJ48279.1 AcrR family transcriptional regulator [Mumia flava]
MSTKRQERRNEIARAAVAPLSEQGYRNVRLSDIGESLGMTGAHLLYYFESKSDLFMSALRMVEQDLRASAYDAFETLPTARERWDWLLAAGAPMGLHDSGLLMWLQAWSEAVHDKAVHDLISELERDWQGLLREVLAYGVARGELDAETDVGGFVEGFSALLDGLTIRVVVGYRPVDKAQAIAISERYAASQLHWRTAAPDAAAPDAAAPDAAAEPQTDETNGDDA